MIECMNQINVHSYYNLAKYIQLKTNPQDYAVCAVDQISYKSGFFVCVCVCVGPVVLGGIFGLSRK